MTEPILPVLQKPPGLKIGPKPVRKAPPKRVRKLQILESIPEHPLCKPVPTLPVRKPVPTLPVRKPVPTLPVRKPVPTLPVREPVATLPVCKPVLPRSSTATKSNLKSCCRMFSCYLFMLLVFLGLCFLWYHPKLPVFYLQSFKINRFNITVNSDDAYLTSATTVKIEAKNPNGKLTVIYSDTHASVTVGDRTDLGSSSLTGFTQGWSNTTSLKFVTQSRSVLPSDAVGMKLKARHRSRGLVVFAEVRTRIRFSVGKLKVGNVGIHVKCGGVSLKRLDAGDMPKCSVNLLEWIHIH